MGSGHKLLADLGGRPVIARTVDAILGSRAVDGIVVVLGHQADAVRAALGPRAVATVTAPDFADGLSASLRAGLHAIRPGDADGLLVCLGDMPLIDAGTIGRLVDAFAGARSRGASSAVLRPARDGVPGHPVLWDVSHVPGLEALRGDAGGRVVLERAGVTPILVPVADDGITIDIDTDAALAAARRMLAAR